MQTRNLERIFHRFLQYRDQTTNDSTLGPWLQQQLSANQFPDLGCFPFAAETYTRHLIAKEAVNGFEALIMRWDQWAQTKIHGHPAFSFYYVISGMFEMEHFTLTPAGLQTSKREQFSSAGTTWFLGQPGRYDNFIHRVTCLQPGYTFHIYSDDAQKGMTL